MTPSVGRVRARWISDEVLDLAAAAPLAGSVTARFRSAFHADVEGFVIAVLPPASPRMPNGMSVPVALGAGRDPGVGDPVRLEEGELVAGRVAIGWDLAHPPRWDARVPRWSAPQRERSGDRANAILASLPERARDGGAGALARLAGLGSDDPGVRDGVEALLAAVRSGDPKLAARAGTHLVGRGPGLTPLGDDLLAATALTVTSVGGTDGSASHRSWLRALAPPGLRGWTTPVSATMLELAIRGRGIGLVHALLDPDPSRGDALARGLDRIRHLGHTTGPAYAAAIGVVARALATSSSSPDNPTKEEIT